MRTRRADITPYRTKDGSEIRELMHPDHHPVRRQSLAEAVIAPGMATTAHSHRASEEIYHVIEGAGRMELDAGEGGRSCDVTVGDTVLILPGVRHRIANTGTGPLRILCCCAPAYSHDDTLLEDGQDAGNDP